MGKELTSVIDFCSIEAFIIEQNKETKFEIDTTKRPAQKSLIGKCVGDTFRLPNINLTYKIKRISELDKTEAGIKISSAAQPIPVYGRVFWVFQNQTYEEESSKGYIFAGFHGPHHWEMLKEVRPGDIIIHSYHAEVVAVSVAKTSAYAWTRFDGAYGRRVDCEYHLLKTTLSTSDRSNKNAALCAKAMYQPFNVNGTGNQGYLYRITSALRDYYASEIVKYNPNIANEITELKKYQTP